MVCFKFNRWTSIETIEIYTNIFFRVCSSFYDAFREDNSQKSHLLQVGVIKPTYAGSNLFVSYYFPLTRTTEVDTPLYDKLKYAKIPNVSVIISIQVIHNYHIMNDSDVNSKDMNKIITEGLLYWGIGIEQNKVL